MMRLESSISFFFVQCWSVFLLDRAAVYVQAVPVTTPVSYTCHFENLWTEATHPAYWPNNPHWSPMVIVSHNGDYSMWWADGSQASAGVKLVAEVGSTTTIEEELKNAGDSVGPYKVGPVFFPTEKKQSIRITKSLNMDESHTLISAISMIAPSPDWFSGFHSVSAVDYYQEWLPSLYIPTYPWDAGTDSGETYESRNAPTAPQEDIFQLDVDNLPQSKVFLSADGTTVDPVARWLCTMNDDDDECTEKGMYRFYLKDKDGVGAVTKKCRWLTKKSEKQKKRICKKDKSNDDFGSANEVCPVTCGKCTPTAKF